MQRLSVLTLPLKLKLARWNMGNGMTSWVASPMKGSLDFMLDKTTPMSSWSTSELSVELFQIKNLIYYPFLRAIDEL